MPAFKDKTGMTYGSLTVLSRAENRGKYVYWNCICSCGKEVCVRGDRLTESQVDGKGNPSCGHVRIEQVRKSIVKDLKGTKIGRLTPLETTEERSHNGCIIWKCQCDCGNITYVPTDSLTKKGNQATQSCGCLQKEKASESIKIHMRSKQPNIGDYEKGFLILKTELRNTNNGHNQMWVFAKCPFCDNTRWFQLTYIRDGSTKSCGCISKSAGEKKIEQLLIENNIPYEREFRFNDCRDKNPLPFDFYINNKYIIEYDGSQHYQPESFGNISKEEAQLKFEITKKHDTMKNQYCFNNNIPIIRIPYTHYNELCLEDLLLKTSKFILKGENNG